MEHDCRGQADDLTHRPPGRTASSCVSRPLSLPVNQDLASGVPGESDDHRARSPVTSLFWPDSVTTDTWPRLSPLLAGCSRKATRVPSGAIRGASIQFGEHGAHRKPRRQRLRSNPARWRELSVWAPACAADILTTARGAPPPSAAASKRATIHKAGPASDVRRKCATSPVLETSSTCPSMESARSLDAVHASGEQGGGATLPTGGATMLCPSGAKRAP